MTPTQNDLDRLLKEINELFSLIVKMQNNSNIRIETINIVQKIHDDTVKEYSILHERVRDDSQLRPGQRDTFVNCTFTGGTGFWQPEDDDPETGYPKEGPTH